MNRRLKVHELKLNESQRTWTKMIIFHEKNNVKMFFELSMHKNISYIEEKYVRGVARIYLASW